MTGKREKGRVIGSREEWGRKERKEGRRREAG